jgi:hypothetical protein
MNSMYDILDKMKLLEGRGSKPDFLDLDKDGNRTEPMKSAAKEVGEANYSAKAARAGKDIGKPGKAFSKIAKDAGERYGSKERGEKVAGAVLAKLRAKEGAEQTPTPAPVPSKGIPGNVPVPGKMDRIKGKRDYYEEDGVDESALQAYLGKKKYGETGMKALQKAGRDGASKETMAKIRARHDKMDEAAGSPDHDKVLNAVAKVYQVQYDGGDEIWDEDWMQDWADVLMKANPTDRELDFIIAKGHMPKRLANVEFPVGDDFQFNEADMEEGNRFTGNLMKARAAGLKKADLDGDGDMEQVREYEFDDRDDFDRRAKRGDTVKTTKGTLTKTDKGVRHEKRHEEEPEARDDDSPRKKGRPAGTKRAIGAKGPTGRSKLLNKDSIKEGDLEEDYDRDEYDEEGEMAKSQARTIEDAAQELQDILDDQENLPEWVQKKINLAMDYIDTARDYMAANRPEDEMMAEKAVSKAQRAAAGIAYAAKKGDIPKSELRGASKEMAKMPSGELKKFAKTKEKGLPAKKEEVEETTVSGSVAPSTEAPKSKGKGGMQFGKGVYEAKIAESFEKQLSTVLNEGMSINLSVGEDGTKNLSVNATDDDALKLAQILKLAGMEQAQGYDEACPACGQQQCGCEGMAEGEYANSPEVETSDTDMMVNGLSGGLNGPKQQANPNNPADNPLAMRSLGQHSSPSLNLGPEADKKVTETRLWDLYKKYESK